MSQEHDLLCAFETHSLEGIRAAIGNGLDLSRPIRGKAPIWWLIEMYTRSRRFAACLRAMIEAGACLDDDFLAALLLDDTELLQAHLDREPEDLRRRLSLDCAYTSLSGVTALHVCAEYNSLRCARVLLGMGLPIDARADVDEHELGGQTPLFHAVNSNRNHCRPMMELLVDAGASLEVMVRGLRWGVGCEWETTLFDVTPISYAQCGLYPQFHRSEEQVYGNLQYMYRNRYGTAAPLRNVPNAYVDASFDLTAARKGQRPESDA